MPSAVFWAGVGGGTEHYRCRTPGAALERLGWDVGYVEDDDSDLAADVVVLQRVLHPAIPDMIRGLQAHGIRVVYDIDDLYDAVPAYNPFSSEVTEQLPILHAALAAADLITCTTPELAETYARFGETRVLPNYLDPDLWSDAARFRPLRSHIHVGWLGAASWRGDDLDLLRPWLPDWLQAHPQVRFVAAGSDRSLLEDLGVGGLVCPPAENHIRPYDHLPAMLGWFDIGLAPLADNRFNRAKSWCKGLEYNAAGAPVVASPSREYRAFVRPGVNGQLVRRNDWPTALERVLRDLAGHRRGAEKVAAEHLIDDHIGRWVDAYTGGDRG